MWGRWGVAFESTLLLCDPHFLSLWFMVVDHPIVPIKNLLLFTDIGLGMKLWLHFFSTKFPRVLCVFQGLGNFHVEFSVSWSQADLQCHLFWSKWAFYSPLAADPVSFCLSMLNGESERSSQNFLCSQISGIESFLFSLSGLVKSINLFGKPILQRIGVMLVVIWYHR